MHTLYPVIKPYQCHELRVSQLHVLYVEEIGNPQGIPIIGLHSGPGAGGDTHLRRFFDPQIYRIVLFDQRGCGRSTPHIELHDNNTQSLLEDIDTIRDYLKINRFVLFGGGWGALLALLYAQLYPQQVSALLLQQIFLGRKKDTDWLYKSGTNLIFPDYWQEFTSFVPNEEQHDLRRFYTQCLQGDNELVRMSAAKSWAMWYARCSSLQSHLYVIEQFSDPHFALALACLQSHYINHRYFIEENQVLSHIHKIRHIPTYLVHGRYDMICPLEGAWELHQALPASNLRIIRDAGHSDREIGIIDALIDASIEISRQGLDAC
ncbi:prolyl aminopeptidase [Legionella micdadei]|uniref:Proline iminopeptidase n=1 Tax=Legionella micdadei TaxID=451 RepID=A0A098GJZ1_LEGMI|nr:prolyl aminopeptidase [Legionella micdadei]ARG96790.1 prolyl aminopeptidase [Legionella micdadei]ARG99523.1 prolyl aminopeptidase [Legionella micdadei]KTD26461.1 proline iminopeptidase [Legionella micdadei]NSL17948.1 prolyl aminopeptidase [Legionella micdadei]CEG61821.1 putative proline iminopeptidase [Legionella micdadei]